MMSKIRWPKWVWVAEEGKIEEAFDKSFRKRGVSMDACTQEVRKRMRVQSAASFNKACRELGYTEISPRP